MQILRTQAIALFMALGLRKPDKWDNKRMGEKLDQLKDMIDTDVKLPDAENETLKKVLAAIEEKKQIEVLTSEDLPEGSSVKAAAKAVEETVEKKKEVEAIKEEIDAPLEPGELPKERVIKTDVSKLEPDPNKPPHVRVSPTTAWHAGHIIRRHGLAAGVTEVMVAELDEQRGKQNPGEAKAALNYCWHAINGFTHEFGDFGYPD